MVANELAQRDQSTEGFRAILSGAIGYRYGWHNALGAYISGGRLSSDETIAGLPHTTTIVPLNVLAMMPDTRP